MSENSAVAPSLAGASSSSAPKDAQQIVAEKSIIQNRRENDNGSFLEKYLWHILTAVVTALATWFTTIMIVRGDIAKNDKEISIVQKDVSYLHRFTDDLKLEIKSLQTLPQEVSSLKQRVDGLSSEVRANSRSTNSNQSIK